MKEDCAKARLETQSFRCHCGNLLARLVADGVELKCRRCKRRVVVPLIQPGESNRLKFGTPQDPHLVRVDK